MTGSINVMQQIVHLKWLKWQILCYIMYFAAI